VTTAILFNPAAGRGHASVGAVVDEARRQFGDVTLLATEGPGDGVRLGRQAAEQGFARLIAVGGDGTVHEAANGILAAGVTTPPALTVVPQGTGNDFAKLVGTHGKSPRSAIRAIAAGRPSRFEVGEAWGEYFVNSLGVGLDHEVPFHLKSVKHFSGTPAYALALLRALRGYRDIGLMVRIGEQEYDGRWLTVAVGIGAIEGGGFHIMPGASPEDGLLDVCAIRPVPLLKLLALIPLVMLGKHTGLREVTHTRTTRVTFRGDAPLQIHSDGELRSNGSTELTVTILPGALAVIKAG
jgi:diacylglycerol kinase (ATP)